MAHFTGPNHPHRPIRCCCLLLRQAVMGIPCQHDLLHAASEHYDVVIIGAGPGGLAAAVALLTGDPSLRVKVTSLRHPSGR